MTYCLGIKTKQGLVAIADTRITSGSVKSTKKKIYTEEKDKHALFIMTSGLRSVRDKATIYFQELFNEKSVVYNKMYKAVNAFGEQVKRVAEEDGIMLKKAGFKFNLNTIIGGQMADDEEPKLFLIYPEGNWVEINNDSPFVAIGNTKYGKTLLNRFVTTDNSLDDALKAGFLSFDETRLNVNDVDYPIDVIVYKKNSFDIDEHRYTENDMSKISGIWDYNLKLILNELPSDWIKSSQNTNK